ncbi:hypothetical protein [Argonema galeatum]|uniref:hypothetical protein n=1 Tax=Argonema galeatum TaxID=2942762 RepID=UPI00201250BF|nr:hypothetical protein [Argonema galeatum]MCL1467826.1 hypothetical protein [Argonema galeatum A003/A1]
MANVKTAISLPESLFKQAEAVAEELKVSRSRLMALALEEFIRRRQNLQLLEKINAAYADPPDEEEQTMLRTISRYHRRIVEGEW